MERESIFHAGLSDEELQAVVSTKAGMDEVRRALLALRALGITWASIARESHTEGHFPERLAKHTIKAPDEAELFKIAHWISSTYRATRGTFSEAFKRAVNTTPKEIADSLGVEGRWACFSLVSEPHTFLCRRLRITRPRLNKTIQVKHALPKFIYDLGTIEVMTEGRQASPLTGVVQLREGDLYLSGKTSASPKGRLGLLTFPFDKFAEWGFMTGWALVPPVNPKEALVPVRIAATRVKTIEQWRALPTSPVSSQECRTKFMEFNEIKNFSKIEAHLLTVKTSLTVR